MITESSSGKYRPGTDEASAAGVEDTLDKFLSDILKMDGGINIPELTQKHVKKAVAAVDWIDSLGADFGDRIPTQPATYDAFETPTDPRKTLPEGFTFTLSAI